MGLMVPWMVTFIPLYLTLQDLGLLDTRTGLVLVYATYNLPFNIFVMVGFLRTLPRELEEAAAMDGAGPATTFVRVILPLLGPGLASVTIISFLNNWNEFFYALVLIHSPIEDDAATRPVPARARPPTTAANWVTLFAGDDDHRDPGAGPLRAASRSRSPRDSRRAPSRGDGEREPAGPKLPAPPGADVVDHGSLQSGCARQ